MTPQRQTRQHPNGDCTRACIASLLDYPIDDVPDWLADGDGDRADGYPSWWYDMQAWLKKRGLAFVEIQLEKKTWMPLPFETWAIFIGPNSDGDRHAIVGKCIHDKFFPVYDPSGRDAALAFANGRVDAICFLVPIDPAAVRFRTADVRQALKRAQATEDHGSSQN